MEKYSPSEEIMKITKLGIKPFFTNHKITKENMLKILAFEEKEEQKFKEMLKNTSLQEKDNYEVKELIFILDYAIRASMISFSKNNIKDHFFFEETLKI